MTRVLSQTDYDRLVLALAGLAPPPRSLADLGDLGAQTDLDHLADLAELTDEEGVPVQPGPDVARLRGLRRATHLAVWAAEPLPAAGLTELPHRAPTGVQLLVPSRPGGQWSSRARIDLATAAAATLRDHGAQVAIDLLPVPPSLADAETRTVLAALGLTPEQLTAGEPPAEVTAAADRHRRPARTRGLVLLFTGLSGSGKSTLAGVVARRIEAQRTVTLLDGDRQRRLLSSGLGFSRADRDMNVTRIGYVAAEIARHGGVAVCAPIAPYAATRERMQSFAVEADATFLLVHVATPLAECERRDRKGLYAKARAGLIPEFTGISDPYEVPEAPDLRIDTTGRSIDDCAEEVLARLRADGFID